jgi:hypothetical protein
MAITAFSQWNATAALNLDLNNIPLDSAVMTASQVDDALREMMAQLKSAGFLTSGVFTATITPAANDGAALGTAALSWSDLFLASGALINIANGNWVATHSSGVLTVGTGDFRVTTAGTNAASVVTVGSAQTLTNKTLTSPVMTTPALGVASATSINFGGTALSAYSEVNDAAISQGAGIAALSGTITTASGTRSYTRIGRMVTVTFDLTITNRGTGTLSLLLTLPFAAKSSGGRWVGQGYSSLTAEALVGLITESGSTVAVDVSTGTSPVVNNQEAIFTITYWV